MANNLKDIARAAYLSAQCNAEQFIGPGEDPIEAANRAVDEFFDPKFVAHDPPGEITPDFAGTKQWNSLIIKAFPDYKVTIEDQIAEDDKVVTRWTARGIHKGEFQGIPPTGKQATLSGITISRYSGGKVVESWYKWDTLDLMRQLGRYA